MVVEVELGFSEFGEKGLDLVLEVGGGAGELLSHFVEFIYYYKSMVIMMLSNIL